MTELIPWTRPRGADHDLVGAWLNFVRDFQVAVDDVSCNIESGLNAIADALALMAQNPGGSGGGCGTGTVGQVVGGLDGRPNEVFLSMEELALTGNPPEG